MINVHERTVVQLNPTRAIGGQSGSSQQQSAQVLPFVAPRRATTGTEPLIEAMEQIGLRSRENQPVATPEQQRMLDELVSALREDRLQVYFQTQHELHSGAEVGCEALLRLSDANGDLLDTQTLIDTAEAFDLIVLVGRQFTRKALREFAQLRAEGHVQGVLALNMSPLELAHPGYAQALLEAISAAGLKPTDVELEVTESQPLENARLLLDQLEQLAEAGVGLAVDDFGTGYAGWHSIARLPVRAVKLDRRLVDRMLTCDRAKTLVRHLAESGRELGFELVAEGIETAEQQQALEALGCTRGQGYFLGVPRPPMSFRRAEAEA
ncbi:MAG: EAL domain-containing protein [Pseudomonadota bacterium]